MFDLVSGYLTEPLAPLLVRKEPGSTLNMSVFSYFALKNMDVLKKFKHGNWIVTATDLTFTETR